VTPNRRGPDREPGARQRGKEHVPEPRRRRRRVTDTKPPSPPLGDEKRTHTLTVPLSASPPEVPEIDHDPDPSFVLTETLFVHDLPRLTNALDTPDLITDLSRVLSEPLYYQDFTSSQRSEEVVDSYVFSTTSSQIISYQNEDHESVEREGTIIDGPSLNFRRQTWWDALLSSYTESNGSRNSIILTSTERELATQNVMDDMRFLFRTTNYWFSFFNVPQFFATFANPVERVRMQPSLVLAALAITTLLRSSELEMGAKGRKKALRLREEAQGALEASLNAGWVNESLVQAAWVGGRFLPL
jgi:hypothetical protein